MKRNWWFGEDMYGLQPIGVPKREIIPRRGPQPTKPVDPNKRRNGYVIDCKITLPDDEIEWRGLDQGSDPLTCPNHRFIKHGAVPLYVADKPYEREPTRLRIMRIKKRCPDCKAMIVQAVPSVDEDLAVTKRLRRDILHTATKHSNVQAANMLGLDRKKLTKVFDASAAVTLPFRTTRLPEVICIDETRLDGKLRFICYDPVAGAVIDVLEDHLKPTVETFFKGITNRHEVRTVVCDMHSSYIRLVEELFDRDKTIIVVDRFHIVKPINRAMSQARGRVISALRREKGGQPEVMKIRDVDDLLMQRRGPLPDLRKEEKLKRIWAIRLTGDLLTPRRSVPTHVFDGEYLREAYRFKEDLQELYEYDSEKLARSGMHALLKEVIKDERLRGDFANVVKMLARHRRYILNFYRDKRTNGFAEGMHKCLKQMSAAQGGLPFEDIRVKARLRYGDHIGRGTLKAY
ncbi:Transposase [Methylobacterium phyllostachyos]|uniref:Transposase n=1 Tax=Methylobacterium phyllostachyos TaxID=582672 RepID=A0A1H0K6Q6_9HYPH|nr:transposase [Methylobacterium phyllostachyos]SDO51576.1 Transposase [Methylobacterium phyllostachyos]